MIDVLPAIAGKEQPDARQGDELQDEPSQHTWPQASKVGGRGIVEQQCFIEIDEQTAAPPERERGFDLGQWRDGDVLGLRTARVSGIGAGS